MNHDFKEIMVSNDIIRYLITYSESSYLYERLTNIWFSYDEMHLLVSLISVTLKFYYESSHTIK